MAVLALRFLKNIKRKKEKNNVKEGSGLACSIRRWLPAKIWYRKSMTHCPVAGTSRQVPATGARKLATVSSPLNIQSISDGPLLSFCPRF